MLIGIIAISWNIETIGSTSILMSFRKEHVVADPEVVLELNAEIATS